MFNGVFHVPQPVNEPVLEYGPGSPEKSDLKRSLKDFREETHESNYPESRRLKEAAEAFFERRDAIKS